MSTATPLHTEIAKVGQTAIYKEILSVCPEGSGPRHAHKLRISIGSDSYDFQSYARVERWSGSKWEYIHEIPYTLMKTEHVLYVAPVLTVRNFDADRRALAQIAEKILF